MNLLSSGRFAFAVIIAIFLAFSLTSFSQSRPQRPTNRPGDDKRNQRPTPKTEEELKKEEEERRRQEEERNAEIADDVVRIETNVVNIEAVVVNRKTGQIITGLKREQFQVFEEGVRKEIANFSTPDAPITVSLVLEYSKWTEVFGRAGGGPFEPGVYESIRPVAQFLTRFIQPPDDYASVIAFDMRPTPITDFTNDPRRINETINLLLRNQPAFRENNLYDAIKFALVGGKGDSVVLERNPERYTEYGGMVDVKAKRRAIILVASGIDTFSRINYSDARKVIQEAGIPIYIISTGNLFYKKYEMYLGATDSITGMPGRLTFQQARNAMNTFAKESGGMHFEMTFPSEIPSYLNSINGLLRSQYSLAYEIDKRHEPGKRYKLEVKVDVDGDGQTDEKQYVVQHRPFIYNLTEKERK
ncbi:VWA domain-containing protein [Leptolyngbya sp. 7M]|uniref:VWA domain-containing protein n=1 Tax=Leptolyngbya sp. 7M TaxID=2812896 RepID=UPI001B8BFD08|nr:VWA domain-containing protein [Leptolyngbya sp. 7M]QYO65787.1 VWA domain-containing protein [Leptolyngbya sp. 7M]